MGSVIGLPCLPQPTKEHAMQTPYTTQVTIWSDNGHTPITGRGKSYCDELVSTTIECTDPADALAKVLEIKKTTPHAYSCHFNMIEYPNQNTKSKFCHYGKI
jgi:hypothetical protein